MTVKNVADVVDSVLKQNRETLMRRGTLGRYQIRGTVDGVDYVLGTKRGRVGQLYPP